MECSELRYKFSVWLSELLICLTVIRQYTTSHATDRHQDPKQKLWAGYRVPLPQCTSYFSSSSVVLRAFSMLCVYSKFRHHPHPLGYLCAKFRFVRGLHCNHSLNYQAYLMHWELKLSLRNKQCVTGRHRGPKRKVTERRHYNIVLSMGQAHMWGKFYFSSLSVVSCAFSALCVCAMHVFDVRASSSSPRLRLCQISFLSCPPLLS